MDWPPSLDGGVHASVADVAPDTAVADWGAVGAVN